MIVDEPVAEGDQLDDWLDEERQAFADKSREAKKTSEIEEPPVQL